ncbi:MAG: RidA family protein [Actinomycetota bacterium]
MTTPHQIVNPDTLAPPVGFSHALVAASGKTVYLGGQAAHDAAGEIVGRTIADQFAQAAANVVRALEAVGAKPEHLVAMQIYVTDADAYRSALGEISSTYQEHFGRHYPAIALFEVTGLFDPAAQVELVCIAVIPD